MEHSLEMTIALVWVSIVVLLGKFFFNHQPAGSQDQKKGKRKAIPSVPSWVPVFGNVIAFLRDPQQLAASITQRFGKSGVVRLNAVFKSLYLVTGAEHIGAIFSDTENLTNNDGLSLAIRNLFGTPSHDMGVFWDDRSGVSLKAHSQSTVKPEDRVYQLIFKATALTLSGTSLNRLARRLQAALQKRIDGLPVQQDWVEMDDLFSFYRALIAKSTLDAVCGTGFLEKFPDFAENFYVFNSRVARLMQGWPKFLFPSAARARERCVSILLEFRKTCGDYCPDIGTFFPMRWEYFSKMEGFSDYAIACSDLGILYGMLSNGMPSAFWALWHTLSDRSLLQSVSAEVRACQTAADGDGPSSFDTSRVSGRPLLQSMYAEIMRKYLAVYITRYAEWSDAKTLGYTIPRGNYLFINSAISHMDERNWPAGPDGKHPATRFWAERFLVPDDTPFGCQGAVEGTTDSKETWPLLKFSLDQYKNAWIPFGGGNHYCPGRHWVKTQILVCLATMISTFDIELVDNQGELKVDKAKYGLGAMQPGEKVAFRIRRKQIV